MIPVLVVIGAVSLTLLGVLAVKLVRWRRRLRADADLRGAHAAILVALGYSPKNHAIAPHSGNASGRGAGVSVVDLRAGREVRFISQKSLHRMRRSQRFLRRYGAARKVA